MPSEPTLKLIHQDSRGEMYQIMLPNGQEIMLLHSKAGAVRGGHSHTAHEVVAMVSGRLVYHKAYARDPDHISSLQAGDSTTNYRDRPHFGEFTQDSWLLEFKFGPNSKVGEWENQDYEPFRKIVRERMDS